MEYLGSLPDQLRHVVMPIRTRESCKGAIETTVCAGGDNKDACRGDSGGPLIDQETGQIVGVVSTGFACGLVGGLYTRVGAFIPFINENLGDPRSPIKDQQPLNPNIVFPEDDDIFLED